MTDVRDDKCLNDECLNDECQNDECQAWSGHPRVKEESCCWFIDDFVSLIQRTIGKDPCFFFFFFDHSGRVLLDGSFLSPDGLKPVNLAEIGGCFGFYRICFSSMDFLSRFQ